MSPVVIFLVEKFRKFQFFQKPRISIQHRQKIISQIKKMCIFALKVVGQNWVVPDFSWKFWQEVGKIEWELLTFPASYFPTFRFSNYMQAPFTHSFVKSSFSSYFWEKRVVIIINSTEIFKILQSKWQIFAEYSKNQ